MVQDGRGRSSRTDLSAAGAPLLPFIEVHPTRTSLNGFPSFFSIVLLWWTKQAPRTITMLLKKTGSNS
jgi:hypothetical protein